MEKSFFLSQCLKAPIRGLRAIKQLFLPLTFLLWVLGGFVFAQSGTMLPDGFIVPNLATAPTCAVADKGKMYFNTTTSMMQVCNGTSWQPAQSQWSVNQALPNTINYFGKVGIKTTTPQYDLDVNGTVRATNNILGNNVSIGGTTPFLGGLQVTDGDIAITSTADAKTWKFNYEDANNWMALQENGITRMIFANGGNIGIGATNPTAKLFVDGAGVVSGNLTVNAGKGIVRTNTANSMRLHTAAHNLGTTFTVNTGGCATSTLSITGVGYTTAPTAYVGNFVSGTGNFGHLIAQIQSTSTTSVVIRLCNNTASNITLANAIYNILVVGQ